MPEALLQSLEQLAGPAMGASIKDKVNKLVALPLPVTTIKAKIRAILEVEG